MWALVKFDDSSEPKLFGIQNAEDAQRFATMNGTEWVQFISSTGTAMTPNNLWGDSVHAMYPPEPIPPPEPVTVTVTKPVFISQATMNTVIELLRYGRPELPFDSQHPSKVIAIKVVKDATGCTLKDGKDYIDALCAEVNPRYPRQYDEWADDYEPEPPF